VLLFAIESSPYQLHEVYKKRIPPEESGGISLTLKTTNMNDVDSYACNIQRLL
jgi:hypothetical protein